MRKYGIPTNNLESKNPDFFCQENVFTRVFFKKIANLKNKIQNGRLKKTTFFKIANSQKIFAKISQIGPWVSRID